MTLRSFVALVFAAMFAFSIQASGQEDDPGRTRAREASVRGQALYDEGRFLEAASAFLEAQSAFPHPTNMFNAAKAFERGAEYEKAAQAYRDYLDLYLKMIGEPAPDSDDTERTIAVLREKAFLALPQVTIDSDPQGADVYLDSPDRLLGQTPFVTHLPEGSHTVFLKAPGFESFERTFVVRSREPLRLSFAMEKIRNEGGIRVRANIRKARIYIDGKVVAVTPFNEILSVEAGPHQVIVEKEDYNQYSQTVDVETGRLVEVTASLYLTRKGFSWRGGLGIASALLGAGALGTGAWFNILANREIAGVPRYDTYRTWGIVGYGVGGGLLALGTGFLIWEFTRTPVRAEDLAVEPRQSMPQFLVGGDGQGFWVGASGKF